jgi:hypothetical protein
MEATESYYFLDEIINANDLLTDDFIEWSRRSRTILKLIKDQGPEFLGKLVRRSFEDQNLRVRHESHQLLDYLVLYEHPQSGIRLRLHLATAEHLQRMHDHRFTFSTLILNGHYQHCLFSSTQDPYAMSSVENAKRYQDRHSPDPAFAGYETESLFHLDWIRGEQAGSCYTLHHSQIHTVYTSKDTVSLVLRGPIQKDRSMIFDQLENKMWWRYGRKDEDDKRIRTKIMSDSKLSQVKDHLSSIGVIS